MTVTREPMDARKLIKIVCPGCNRFLAYIPVDSDLYCPRCRMWVYQGGDSSKQKAKKAKGIQKGK